MAKQKALRAITVNEVEGTTWHADPEKTGKDGGPTCGMVYGKFGTTTGRTWLEDPRTGLKFEAYVYVAYTPAPRDTVASITADALSVGLTIRSNGPRSGVQLTPDLLAALQTTGNHVLSLESERDADHHRSVALSVMRKCADVFKAPDETDGKSGRKRATRSTVKTSYGPRK